MVTQRASYLRTKERDGLSSYVPLLLLLLQLLSACGSALAADHSNLDITSVLPVKTVPLKSHLSLQAMDSYIYSSKLESIIVLRGDVLTSVSLRPPHTESFIAKDKRFLGHELGSISWVNGSSVVVMNAPNRGDQGGIRNIVFNCRSKSLYSMDPSDKEHLKGCGYQASIAVLAADHKTAVMRLDYAGPKESRSKDDEYPRYCWTNILNLSFPLFSRQ